MMKYENILSTCPYCGFGCNIYHQVFDDELIGVLPCKSDIVSQGKICIKGWNAHEFVYSKDRLTKPLVKHNGSFDEVSWDEAINITVKKFIEYKETCDPDSIGVLSSAKCTNEENYLIMKFVRAVLGTNNIDNCVRLCHSPTIVGLFRSFGSGAITNSIVELENSDCILVTGSNTTEQNPLVASYIMRGKEKGKRLIVVDPRKTPLTKFADFHLIQKPGTDVAWINGFINVIINDGLEDRKFIEDRTEGFNELLKTVKKYTPAYVETITGIPAEDLISAARLYAKADNASIVYSTGITQHTTGVDNVRSLANLAMLTGNVGRPNTGIYPLSGQVNIQGACDVGALPNFYSGYQSVSEEKIRAKFELAWKTKLPTKPGLSAVEMINDYPTATKGNIKMMYIMGANPVLSHPDINRVKEMLNNLEFLVVQDIFLTETAQLADVVLPAASYAEKNGTFTSLDRRIQMVRKAIEPIGECRTDWKIICELARRMGSKEFDYSSPTDIMNEISSLTPIYGGITYDRLEKNGVQWPCPSKKHPGTPDLHKDGFSNGRGKFVALEFKKPAELPDKNYPLILTTGKIMFHSHTGTMTRKTELLNREVPTGYVEINPEDAKKIGISDGELVSIQSRRGEIKINTLVTRTTPKGVIFIPFHFSECAANILTNPAFDPSAKIPEFKICAVRIKKIE